MESRFLGIGIITALLLPTFAEERAGKICVPHGEVPLKKLLWASLCSAGRREGTATEDGIQALCRVDREAGTLLIWRSFHGKGSGECLLSSYLLPLICWFHKLDTKLS